MTIIGTRERDAKSGMTIIGTRDAKASIGDNRGSNSDPAIVPCSQSKDR